MTPPVLPFAVPDCAIDLVRTVDTTLVIEAHTLRPAMCCPDCGQASTRIHSRYRRLLRDLPLVDQSVRLLLQVRRFFCEASVWPRRTFAERLADLAAFRAQRTPRLSRTLGVLGFAAGGEAAARVAQQLHMRASGDTLLRIMRATPSPNQPTPRVLGVDDVALRKGRVYGTILIDLEQRRPVDLLADRTAETLASWLRAHPGVELIARDRARDYARGASEGAPEAIQLADRFHLLGNLREVAERSVQRMVPALRRLLDPPHEDNPSPAPAPAAAPRALPRYGRPHTLQQLQDARQAERERQYQQVKTRFAQGLSQRQIARETGLCTHTNRRWLRTESLPPERRGYRLNGKIDPYISYLQARLAQGCTNQSRLWREIQDQRFSGTRSLVSKWIGTHGSQPVVVQQNARPQLPSAKSLSWLVFRAATEHDEDEQALWRQVCAHRVLAQLHDLIQEFREMVRQRRGNDLDAWLSACRSSAIPELRNFVDVLQRDYDAVKAGLTQAWSTGPVEGHVNRLKLIKRSAYGRMHVDLLRQRVLHAA